MQGSVSKHPLELAEQPPRRDQLTRRAVILI